MKERSCGIGVLLWAWFCLSVVTPADGQSHESGIVFSRDILPVLRESFIPLLTKDVGLDASSWESLMQGSDQGAVVIPFDADRSLIVERALQAGADAPDDEAIDLVRRWIDHGARNDAGVIPHADADQLLYVCNQGSAVISVIDMEAQLVIRTVDLRNHGFSENAKPHHVVVSPDGSLWYVSLIGENAVLQFNRENELVGRATFEVPGMLALDPTSDRLYVGRSMSAVNPPQRIGTISLEDMEVEEIDVLYPRPHALNLSGDGRTLFSASLGVNQMAAIDTETMDTELIDIPGPYHSLVQFSVTPDGHTMIAGGHVSGALLFFDLADPTSPSPADSIQLGGAPWHPSFLPDGRAVVPRKMANAVSIIDVEARETLANVTGEGIAEPHGSAVRPDGRYVYVSNNNLNATFTPRYPDEGPPNGSVVVIDAETLEIVKIIEVERYPTGVGARSTL